MTYDLIIMTPNADSADAINHAYRESYAHDPNKRVRAYSVFSYPQGARCDKLVIMPMPHWASPEAKHLYEVAVKAHAILLTPKGQVIRL